jgi:type II secretory pathway component PulL
VIEHPDSIDQWTIELLTDADMGQEIFVHVIWQPAVLLRAWLPCLRTDNGRPSLIFLSDHLTTLDGWGTTRWTWLIRQGAWSVPSNVGSDPAGEFVQHLGKVLHNRKDWFERRTL